MRRQREEENQNGDNDNVDRQEKVVAKNNNNDSRKPSPIIINNNNDDFRSILPSQIRNKKQNNNKKNPWMTSTFVPSKQSSSSSEAAAATTAVNNQKRVAPWSQFVETLKGGSSSSSSSSRLSTGLAFHHECANHHPPRHPNANEFEIPERTVFTLRHINECGLDKLCAPVPVVEASFEQLSRAHDPSHIHNVNGTAVLGKQALANVSHSGDLYVSDGTARAARLAAGGVTEAALKVAKGELQNAMCIVRPPGHHCPGTKASGFCFFNNVAVAARAAQSEVDGVKKVLIVDWDVHHGDGTESVFYEDPSVCVISVHQHHLGKGHVFHRPPKEEMPGAKKKIKKELDDDDQYQDENDDLSKKEVANEDDLLALLEGLDGDLDLEQMVGEALEENNNNNNDDPTKDTSKSPAPAFEKLEDGNKDNKQQILTSSSLKRSNSVSRPISTAPALAEAQQPVESSISNSAINKQPTVAEELAPAFTSRRGGGNRRAAATSTMLALLAAEEKEKEQEQEKEQANHQQDEKGKNEDAAEKTDEKNSNNNNNDKDDRRDRMKAMMMMDQQQSKVDDDAAMDFFAGVLGQEKLEIKPRKKNGNNNNTDDDDDSSRNTSSLNSQKLYSSSDEDDDDFDSADSDNLRNKSDNDDDEDGSSENSDRELLNEYYNHSNNNEYELSPLEAHTGAKFQRTYKKNAAPFYPGTGHINRVGAGAGVGTNINIPWPCTNFGDVEYLRVMNELVIPVANEFEPDLVIISCGLDCVAGDLLGSMKVTPSGVFLMTSILSEKVSKKVVVALEGGYMLRNVALCSEAALRALLQFSSPYSNNNTNSNNKKTNNDEDDDAVKKENETIASSGGGVKKSTMLFDQTTRLIEDVKSYHSPYWKCMQE